MGFPRTLLFWVLLASFTPSVFAQVLESGDSKTAKADILISTKTGLASMISGKNQGILPIEADPNDPLAVFKTYGEAFGVKDAINELVRIETFKDHLGQIHHRYQQVHRDIEVFTGRLIVHQNEKGEFLAVNGDFYPIRPGVPTQPLISVEEAQLLVQNELGLVNPVFGEARLVLVDPGWYGDPSPGLVRLAYKMSAAGDGFFAEYVLIDARDRSVFDRWPAVHSAIDRKIYDGSGGSLPGNLVRGEGASQTGDPELDNLYDFVGDFHQFLLQGYGRDSIDGAGAPLVATGRWSAGICPNAIWNGSGTAYCAGLATDDIVGHEFGHGLVDYTADLIYQNQSGQLNESFADVFGELIDLYNGNASEAGPPGGPAWPGSGVSGTDTPNTARSGCGDGSVRWLMGEDSSLGAIRDMWSPTCAGDPDRALSALYESTCCDPGFDAGGVHFGSGVSNHAFAMLTDGKTFNGVTIQSLGPIKTGAIWYRALSVYLTPASGFNEAYNAFIQAANDLVGSTPLDPRTGAPSSSTFTAADVTEVTNALTVVEMNASGICALPPAPANDDCATAEVITPGLHAHDNRGATDSGIVADDTQCSATYLGQVSRDIWYSFTPVQDGTITVSTCNIGGFDTDLVVYTGVCGSLVQQGCNGDASGCSSFTSILADLPVTGGTEYLVRLGAFGTSGGVGELELVFNPGGGTPIEVCNNGADDDGDGAIDCADTDCSADPACSGTPVEDCTNGVDDDGDGAVDCLDSDCVGAPGCSGIAGDECNDPIVASAGLNAVDTTQATTSTDASDPTQCSGTFLGGFHSDIWYSFTPASDGLLTASLCGLINFDSDIAVYQGACGSLSQIACNGDTPGCAGLSSRVTDVPVSSGVEYRIRVGGWNETANGTGDLELTLSSGSQENCQNGTDDDLDGLTDCEDPDCSADPGCIPFPGDECTDALPVFEGLNSLDTSGASDSSESVPACGSFLGAMSNDTWYQYVASATGVLTVSACDMGAFDSGIVIYSGSCGALSMISCSGEGCNPLAASVSASVNAGQQILIRFGAANTGQSVTGNLQVTLEIPQPEDCQNGIDDDLDGLIDCLDTDCSSDPVCTCDAITNLTCSQTAGLAVDLAWSNGELYQEIQITRNGALQAVLSGSDSSYTDNGGSAGNRVYSVIGVCAQNEATAVCVIDVQEPSGFSIVAPQVTASFDGVTGVGSVSVDLSVAEEATNPGFPNATQGFSLSIANDPALIQPVSVQPSALLQQLNGSSGPDFFTEGIFAGGITLGVVYSFTGLDVIQFTSESSVANISYDTVAGNLAGQVDPVQTALTWSESVGPNPVENIVVVNAATVLPVEVHGSVTLEPQLGGVISRADCNADGSFNIADAVEALNGLFNSAPIDCVDACDANDDGQFNVADPVFTLSALFSNGALPPAPFGVCGVDPTEDGLTCDQFAPCP